MILLENDIIMQSIIKMKKNTYLKTIIQSIADKNEKKPDLIG